MKTLISSTEGLLFVILLMVAFALWLQRYKVFRSLGPVLTVVIIGIVLSNTHVVPISHDLYSSISTYCVQAGISICLLSMNVTELKKLNRQPVIALVSAIFSVCIVAIGLGIIFAPQITQMGTDYILLFNSFLCNKSHSCCKAYFTSSSCVKGMKYVISNDGTAANST